MDAAPLVVDESLKTLSFVVVSASDAIVSVVVVSTVVVVVVADVVAEVVVKHSPAAIYVPTMNVSQAILFPSQSAIDEIDMRVLSDMPLSFVFSHHPAIVASS